MVAKKAAKLNEIDFNELMVHLRYDNGGNNEEIASLSGQRNQMSGGSFKIISQIKDENLGMGEKVNIFLFLMEAQLKPLQPLF